MFLFHFQSQKPPSHSSAPEIDAMNYVMKLFSMCILFSLLFSTTCLLYHAPPMALFFPLPHSSRSHKGLCTRQLKKCYKSHAESEAGNAGFLLRFSLSSGLMSHLQLHGSWNLTRTYKHTPKINGILKQLALGNNKGNIGHRNCGNWPKPSHTLCQF